MWQTAVPDSPYPKLAYIDYMHTMLWRIRGGGFSSTVGKDAWSKVQEGADEALGRLQVITFQKKKSPVYFELAIKLEALSSREDKKAAMFKFFDEGSKLYPTYYNLDLTMAFFLEQKWFGRPGEYVAFAARQAERVGGDEGAIVYNRIIRNLISSYNYGSRMATRSRSVGFFYLHPDVNWSMMRKGFEKLTEKYPVDWHLNDFAWFACLANDRQTAAREIKRIERIGGQLIPEVWGGEASMQAWLDWATLMPSFPLAASQKKGWKKHPVPGYRGYILGSERNGKLNGLAEFDNNMGEHIEYVTLNGEAYGIGYLRGPSKEIRGRPMGGSSSGGPVFGQDGWISESLPEGRRIYMGGLSNNQPDGVGLDRLDGQYEYLGRFHQGKRDGLGKLVKGTNGKTELYVGEFKNGYPDGFGVLLGAREFNGLSYVGEFRNGQPEGIGAVIATPVWVGQIIRDEDVQFVKVAPDGSVSAIGPQDHPGFGVLHFRINRVSYDYVGYVEGQSPKGMGVRLMAGNSPNFDVGNWVGNDKSVPRSDRYHTNNREEFMFDSRWGSLFIPRGYWIGHGRLKDGVWYKGTIIFADGRILWLNNPYSENLKRLFASSR